MHTVPDRPDEVRADQIQPGAILPLATDDLATDGGLHEVAAVTPYTDGDGDHMIALTVKPLGVGDPEVVRFLAGFKLALATEAEIAEHRDGERRRELAAALVDLAERIERDRLPIPRYRLRVGGVLDSFADLERWADHLGVRIERGGPLDDIPVINLEAALVGDLSLDLHFQAGEFPADYETAAEGADLPASADASGETGTEGPVADAAAAPAAPAPNVGAAGVTPFGATPPGPGMTYDPMPTCLYGPGEQRDAFMEAYANGLDATHPGWHRHGLDRMDAGLAREAKARRRAEGSEQ